MKRWVDGTGKRRWKPRPLLRIAHWWKCRHSDYTCRGHFYRYDNGMMRTVFYTRATDWQAIGETPKEKE